MSTENKNRMIDLVKGGRISDATALAMELGLDHLDLSGANLSYADLFEANLTNANLAFASLVGADLSDASLFDADLSNANLTGANLSGANLIGAFIDHATGINIGPNRTFIGIPYLHTETKSNLVPGRTNLRRTR